MKEDVTVSADVDGDREVSLCAKVNEQETQCESVRLAEAVQMQGLDFVFEALNEGLQRGYGLFVRRIRVKVCLGGRGWFRAS